MHLKLEILDGSMRGEQFSFDLIEGQEVRLGRDGEVCEVGLTEEYVRVSRQHCALRSVLGRVRIRTNKQNAVIVGKDAVFDDAVLEDGTVMRLGHGGPRVRIEVRYSRSKRSPASTITFKPNLAAPELELRKQAAAVQEELEATKRRGWIAKATVAAVAAVAGISVVVAVQARSDAALLHQASLDDRQRAMLVSMIEDRANAAPQLSETATRVARSVYCVMKTGDRGATPIGTAWVVDRDEGLLATNAHVAEAFVDGETIVRPTGARSADLAIASARSHPAYQEFADQLGRYCEALDIAGVGSSNRTMRGFDVALLVVAEDDREALGPALPLLAAGASEGIETGSPCATVGFPAEGIGFNPEQPQHKTHLGYVVAMTDYFMAAGASDEAQLVHTSLPVAGGASGSPVVDQRGRVIGLISSANVVHSHEGRRIPLAGTTCAQRVDTLHELLEGRVEQPARRRRWKALFDEALANAKKTIEQVLLDSLQKELVRRGSSSLAEVMTRDQIALDWDAQSNAAIKTVEVRAPESSLYLICAVADDAEDINMTVFLPDGSMREDQAPDWFPSVGVELKKDEVVQVATFRPVDKATRATILVVRASQ